LNREESYLITLSHWSVIFLNIIVKITLSVAYE